MGARRDFLRNMGMAAMASPFFGMSGKQAYSLDILERDFENSDAYWQMIRKQFPLKEGQTYFNNGTMAQARVMS